MTEISEAAIDAAAKAAYEDAHYYDEQWWDESSPAAREEWRHHARIMLEAAAPHMKGTDPE